MAAAVIQLIRVHDLAPVTQQRDQVIERISRVQKFILELSVRRWLPASFPGPFWDSLYGLSRIILSLHKYIGAETANMLRHRSGKLVGRKTGQALADYVESMRHGGNVPAVVFSDFLGLIVIGLERLPPAEFARRFELYSARLDVALRAWEDFME